MGDTYNTLPEKERQNPVKGCPFSAGMLAFVLVEKYGYHTPKNQIKRKLREMGAIVNISFDFIVGCPTKISNFVINKEYNADMLAAAMAKHQGFTYAPDAELYWKHGHSSEHDFIFTTTQLLTAEMLEVIHEQLGENESLLICCSKFQPECRNKFPNITIKKIPKVLLDTCEFDHDDYSLNIVSVPDIEDEEWEDLDPEDEYPPTDKPNLFDEIE